MKDHPKIGLVIGSEGLKALAALPVIEFMQQSGLSPDLVVGCGGGGLVAAFMGAGYSMIQVEKAFCRVQEAQGNPQANPNSILSLLDQNTKNFDMGSGLYNPGKLQRAYKRIFKEQQMEDLRPKVVIQSVDIQNGESVSLETGPVSDAVYASTTVFPLMPPLIRNGALLVDGSYSQPLPVLEAVNRGMDLIIGIYVEDDFALLPGGFNQCYMNVIRTIKKNLFRAQQFQAIDMHNYEILTIFIPEERKNRSMDIETLIQLGREGLGTHKQAIIQAASQFGKCEEPQFTLHNK